MGRWTAMRVRRIAHAESRARFHRVWTVGQRAGGETRRHQPSRCGGGRAGRGTRFGRIDVLANNAASFHAGYFEEPTPEQIERQLAASLFGAMNVTGPVLPVMREQRSGHIITISSSAALGAGYDFVSAYAASKFGLEGWMESSAPRLRRSASRPRSSIRGSSARNFSRINRRGTPRRRSPTMTRVTSCTTSNEPRETSTDVTHDIVIDA
jgi:hypothetical protein